MRNQSHSQHSKPVPSSEFRVPSRKRGNFSHNPEPGTRKPEPLLILFLGCLLALTSFAADRPLPASGENGRQFVNYDPPNEQQVKIELNFKMADPLPGGKIWWRGTKIKQFPVTGGEPEMIAETPECVSDNRLDEISSTNSFQLHASKGSLFLEGVGFQFYHKDMDLIVSNQVHSVLQLRPPTNGIAVPTVITSHRGEFKMKTDATNGMALYEQNVRVLDPQMKLDCEWLRADLPKSESGQTNRPNHIVARTNVVIDFINEKGEKIHALGTQAVYDRVGTNDTLELTGNPRVDLTEGWMTADRFFVDRGAGKLHGVGNYHFHYRPANSPRNVTTAVEQQIASDNFDFDMNTSLAHFWGHVRGDHPRMKLLCENLTTILPKHEAGNSNRLDHVLAETNVAIDFIDTTNGRSVHATSQKAVYDYKVVGGVTNETLELTGNPAVQLTNGWMTADTIMVDHAQGHLSGVGNHHSVLKMIPSEPATMDTEIFSDRFEYSTVTSLAVYRGAVRAYDPQLNLTNAAVMTVQLAQDEKGQTNRIRKITAEGNVALDFTQKAFDRKDITNLTAFVTRLKTPKDPVAQFVSSHLAPPTKLLLNAYTNGTNMNLQVILGEELNRLVQSGPIYDAARFTNVYLSLDTLDLLKSSPMGVDVMELNRLLLVDAFRGELTRGQKGEKTHATGDRAIYTNQGKGNDASATALLELYGHPTLENPSGTVKVDQAIIYNRITSTCQFIGHPRFYPNLKKLAKNNGPQKTSSDSSQKKEKKKK